MRAAVDMHEAPRLRRWSVRLGLAVVVAIAIAYLPGQLLERDPRAVRLSHQLDELRGEARELAAGNAGLYKEVMALRSDVGAIEDRARADLGMAYPGELVLRVRRSDVREAVLPASAAPSLGAAPRRSP